ncbi:hypothetical protein OC842_006690 [Tilletia horrida]|uniref:Uncharacterized protein n=1 Tax=Tilletia horrida TaxID=155126 RepID=A0AAN6JHG0_9BASI|nr:hypothetical protein OC842_006690 [Tilletia horrida]
MGPTPPTSPHPSSVSTLTPPPSSPPGYPSDEAEEHDSLPEDSSQSESSSVDGDDLAEPEQPSSDGPDDGADLLDFVVAAVPSDSEDEDTSDEEEEAQWTQDTDVSIGGGDAVLEQQMAEMDPDGEFVPLGGMPVGDLPEENAGAGDDDDEQDADDQGDGEEVGVGNDDDVDAGHEAENDDDGVGQGVAIDEGPVVNEEVGQEADGAAEETDDEDDSDFEIVRVISGKRSASEDPDPHQADPAQPAKKPKMPAIETKWITITGRVVCKWMHDDRDAEPLQPWKHNEENLSLTLMRGHADFYPARRLSNGLVQIEVVPSTWIPVYERKLRRDVTPPSCDDCCRQDIWLQVLAPSTLA